MDEFTTTSSRLVYENPWLRLREDEFERPDGSRGVYGVVEKTDFAIVVPVDDAGFHLVEQYRYPVRARLWEFPQGAVEDEPDLTPEEVARRELAEETGFRAGSMTHLGTLHEAYGISAQRGHVFLATDLTPGPTDLSPEEAGLVCAPVRFEDFPRMVADGRITDASTLAAYALLQLSRGVAVTGP